MEVPEIVMTFLHRLAYSEEFGQFGRKPYAVLSGAYEFTASPADFFILRRLYNLGVTSPRSLCYKPGAGFLWIKVVCRAIRN
jgi:type VI secretion system protein ImpC